MPELSVHPLTPERWPDFVRLFGERGVGGGCWCMFWRLQTKQQYLEQKGEANKEAMRSLVRSGDIPGLLAYAGSEPMGWCAVAPREAFPALERSRSRKAIDGEHVWSINLHIRRAIPSAASPFDQTDRGRRCLCAYSRWPHRRRLSCPRQARSDID